jgi:hypothetical protein
VRWMGEAVPLQAPRLRSGHHHLLLLRVPAPSGRRLLVSRRHRHPVSRHLQPRRAFRHPRIPAIPRRPAVLSGTLPLLHHPFQTTWSGPSSRRYSAAIRSGLSPLSTQHRSTRTCSGGMSLPRNDRRGWQGTGRLSRLPLQWRSGSSTRSRWRSGHFTRWVGCTSNPARGGVVEGRALRPRVGKRAGLVLLAVAAVGTAGAVVGAGTRSTVASLLLSLGPPCLFHRLTGLYCPGCGTTRALFHLARGETLAAMRSNPLLVVALPLLFLVWLQLSMTGAWRAGLRKVVYSPFVGWGFAVLTILFAVLRNLPFWPFRWLAP